MNDFKVGMGGGSGEFDEGEEEEERGRGRRRGGSLDYGSRSARTSFDGKSQSQQRKSPSIFPWSKSKGTWGGISPQKERRGRESRVGGSDRVQNQNHSNNLSWLDNLKAPGRRRRNSLDELLQGANLEGTDDVVALEGSRRRKSLTLLGGLTQRFSRGEHKDQTEDRRESRVSLSPFFKMFLSCF